MKKSTYSIPKMDCPSEENLIRMKLDGKQEIQQLRFDLQKRQLEVFHQGSEQPITEDLSALNLGARLTETLPVSHDELPEAEKGQRRLLWIVLSINFAFFIIEMTTGWISHSMGLIADSLDMLADAFVYGISLWAVGGSLIRKKQVARLAGYFQMLLAVLGFTEVVRRTFMGGLAPDYQFMIYVSILALIANGFCLFLLQRSKSKEEAHMQASMIFTSNDVIINLGVIMAGCFVLWLESGWPDLVIGSVVFLLVIQGAIRILKLGR